MAELDLKVKTVPGERYKIVDEVITRDMAIRIANEFARQFRDRIDATARLYLFGSTVKGLARPWSDIDVAVISDKFQGNNASMDVPLYAVMVYRICSAIEVHTFTPKQWESANNDMVAEILETGVEVL